MEEDNTRIFDIKGMTCDNCVQHVTKAVRAVAGVRSANVELASNSARVEGDFDEKEVIEAIEEEGYEASIQNS